MSLMNKSEVFNKEQNKESTGWKCPICGKVWSPMVKSCTCTKAEGKDNFSKVNWIKD